MEKKTEAIIKKKWEFEKKKLEHDRGIWQPEETAQGVLRYKIDKAEDSLRRRMRLKRDYHADKKEYLSVAKYQEKLKALLSEHPDIIPGQDFSMSKLPSLEEYRKSRGIRREERKTTEEETEAENKDLPGENNTQTKELIAENDIEEQKEEHEEFPQLTKKDVLTAINEDVIESTPPSTPIIHKWKNLCEKITLKGAVYGELEIVQNEYLSFTPLKEERSDDPPYCFGALVSLFYMIQLPFSWKIFYFLLIFLNKI